MSWVSDVLLSVDVFEDGSLVQAFTDWLETQAPRREPPEARGVGFLRPLDESPDAWGGWKNPESSIWGGTLNHADIPAAVRRFAETPWRQPDLAQLMIRDQEQGAFRMWMIRDGQARQYAPLPDYGPDDYGEDE